MFIVDDGLVSTLADAAGAAADVAMVHPGRYGKFVSFSLFFVSFSYSLCV
jgi:hypothetical protein